MRSAALLSSVLFLVLLTSPIVAQDIPLANVDADFYADIVALNPVTPTVVPCGMNDIGPPTALFAMRFEHPTRLSAELNSTYYSLEVRDFFISIDLDHTPKHMARYSSGKLRHWQYKKAELICVNRQNEKVVRLIGLKEVRDRN